MTSSLDPFRAYVADAAGTTPAAVARASHEARADRIALDIAAMDRAMVDPDGPYTAEDRRQLVDRWCIAVLSAVDSADAWDTFERGRMDLGDDDLDGTPARVIVDGLRSAFSACGGHDQRDDACTDCAALPDLR